MWVDGRERTAAVSTPVGPPPQTTKLSNRLRSSSDVDGSEAISKLSAIQTDKQMELMVQNYSPRMRRRMACASATVLRWKQCSSPGTPCVLDTEPTAITSLSYLDRAS
jgi:hypothetical protein